MDIKISECNHEIMVNGFAMRKHDKATIHEVLRIAAKAIEEAQRDLYLRLMLLILLVEKMLCLRLEKHILIISIRRISNEYNHTHTNVAAICRRRHHSDSCHFNFYCRTMFYSRIVA